MATISQPEQPKKSNTGRRILVIVVILALACIVCVGGVFVIGGPAIGNVFNSVVGLVTASTDFMTAVKNNDYAKAYSMIDPAQQQAFGGEAEGMQQLFQDRGWNNPTSWDLHSTNVTNDQAVVWGNVTYASGVKQMEVNLRKIGDAWKVMGFGPSTRQAQ